MGVKRLNRSRLYNVERKGLDIKASMGASDIMLPAIVSATQSREGHKVVSDIVVDLGAAAAGLKTQSDDDGSNGAKSKALGTVASTNYLQALCQVTQGVFGIVTSVETICLEAFADDGTDASGVNFKNIDLVYGNAGAQLGAAAGGATPFSTVALADIGASVGKHLVGALDGAELDTNGSSGKYLYFAGGAKSASRASCTINCASLDLTKLVNGMNAIQLLEEDGATKANFVLDTGEPWDDTTPTQVGVIMDINWGANGGNAADSIKKFTFALSTAIDTYDSGNHFDTDAASRNKSGGGGTATTNATSITVTRANATPLTTENTANVLVDAYEASGITITDFTGGIPNSVTSGKFLIRITGFMIPEDI